LRLGCGFTISWDFGYLTNNKYAIIIGRCINMYD